MKRMVMCSAIGLLVSVLTCAVVWAQATAQISGRVTDATGAVIPGVDVSVTQTGTGLSRNAITDETGNYTFTNLPIGPYRLEASLAGFRTYVQTGIVLSVNDSRTVNVRLEVGQVDQTIEVQANAAVVETRNAGIGQIMENERILELPLNGRNVNDLVTLAGGAVQTGTTSIKQFQGTPEISVAGNLQFSARYTLDGASHIDIFGGYSTPMPFPDALEEFKVETSGLGAQAAKGSLVGAVTKSGANQFHGSLFEFARNDLFNARNYFSKEGSTLKRHQYGGTIGGPILQNKLFFFAGYQRTTLRQDPDNVERFVPTGAMLAGDWTEITSPACNAGRRINLRAPFVDNRINPALFSPAALKITSRLPKSDDPCGLVVFGPRDSQNRIQAVGKVDYQWGANHSVFGRYLVTTQAKKHPLAFDPGNLLNTNFSGQDDLAQSYAVGDTYLIGTNMVNAFRVSVVRVAVFNVGSEFFGPADVGIDAFSYLPKFFSLSVTGGPIVGGGTKADFFNRATSYHLSDDMSHVRGPHQLMFGGHLSHGRSNTNANSQSPGSYSFNGQFTGLGMGDFLTGKLQRFSQGAPTAHYERSWYGGSYAADTWRATPNLTVNLGVRWEPYLPPGNYNENGRVYNFDFDRLQQGVRTTVFNNAPDGFLYRGDPRFKGDRAGILKRWSNFSPHVGLAWDPQGEGRMSIRASYALNHDFYPLRFREGSVGAPPWGNRLTVNNPPGGLDNPWAGVPGGNVFPFVIDADATFPNSGNYISTPFGIRNPYASSWNLTIQREVVGDLLLSASYMGSQTAHIWETRELNPAIFFPGNFDRNGTCTVDGLVLSGGRPGTTCSTTRNTNDRRLISLAYPKAGQKIGSLDTFDDSGTQSYNGLLLSVQRRAARGLTINTNYTWSHCIGDHYETEGPGNGDGYSDPNNRNLDRGNCLSDRRHIFNFTTVAETPQFANSPLRTVASGWRLAVIYRALSGRWLNIVSGSDVALTGIQPSGGGQRVDRLLADPYDDRSAQPRANFLNAAAFAIPTVGTLGNLGRNSVEGVGTWQFDLALSRNFSVRENQRLEFRVEAYNVTNSFRPVNPITNLSDSRFGQIRESEDPRIMQFVLKYSF